MAQGYVPIQTITLTGTASSIDFVNIPQNYTDLKLLISSRNNDAGFFGNILLTINDSVSSYTNTFLQANGSSIGGGQVAQMIGDMNTSATTSNLFNNIEVYIPNYSGSTYKFFSADSIGENNGSQAYIMLMANTWAVTSAITKISLTNRNGGVSFVANTSVTLYGIGAHRASGGTITADSQYTYHTFTSSGTFTALEKIKGAQVLVIAGGAGGGSDGSGGGGAGGVAYAANRTLNAGTSYSAIVGAGSSGVLTIGTATSNGSNSLFTNITAFGGGAPGMGTGTGNYYFGYAGGSGGGVRGNRGAATGGSATQTSTLDIVGYGNSGGSSTGGAQVSSTGGGGAGSAGLPANTNGIGSHGGDGTSLFSDWAIATGTGVAGFYAGGGGGGGNTAQGGTGGRGGGGRGAGTADAATSGTANTGSGGGGTDGNGGAFGNTVGNGGSGIVIIRYPN